MASACYARGSVLRRAQGLALDRDCGLDRHGVLCDLPARCPAPCGPRSGTRLARPTSSGRPLLPVSDHNVDQCLANVGVHLRFLPIANPVRVPQYRHSR
jgi:hypothetical protein